MFFSENVIFHIKLKGMNLTAYKLANCRYTHPRPQGIDHKVKTVVFSSENVHVAYQNKGNDTYNNMQAGVCPNTPSTPGVG